jgi:hypothetical protein
VLAKAIASPSLEPDAHMSIRVLLDRLDAPREVAPGRWRARCPAHGGQSRDVLSIRENSDGTVLLKCFHGCTALEIVSALGLQLSDLFPRLEVGTHAVVTRRLRGNKGETHVASIRCPRADWAALIAACERDLLLVKIVLASAARRETLDDVDAAACGEAATRVYRLIQEARRG